MSIASVPVPVPRCHSPSSVLCDLLFISFGAWSLLAPVFYFLGGSFPLPGRPARFILCVASLIYAAFILLHTAERRLIDYRPDDGARSSWRSLRPSPSFSRSA
jgi:hypothetical protein